MPRREKRCCDCLDKGYLSVLAWQRGDERKIVPCDCKHGRKFMKMWRKESPPTKLKPRNVDT